MEAARAETAELRQALEGRAAALEAAIASAAEAVQRALETRLASLHSTLLRLDRQGREQSQRVEEAQADASSQRREAAEERATIESNVAALTARLDIVEREAAAAARRAGDLI